jgi:hypothetical protein
MKWNIIKLNLLVVCIVIQGMLSGCSTASDCTVLSSKIVRLNDFELDKADRKEAYGEDVRHWFLFIPFGSQPTMKEALDRGLEQGGGDVMTDVRVDNWGWTILIYSQGGWSVKGTVVKTRN